MRAKLSVIESESEDVMSEFLLSDGLADMKTGLGGKPAGLEEYVFEDDEFGPGCLEELMTMLHRVRISSSYWARANDILTT